MLMPPIRRHCLGKIVFAGEGQGANVPPALYMLDPNEPYPTTGLSCLLNPHTSVADFFNI